MAKKRKKYKARKKKYKRPFPNNKPVLPMEKKIPFNLSIRRKVRIEFENVCVELGISHNEIAEGLFTNFINDIRNEQNNG